MEEIYWILAYEHEYGTDLTIYKTQEAALNSIHKTVQYWWDEELSGYDMPEDQLEAVEMYFDLVDGEYYTITSCKVEP